ncbi:MAG TPA: ATP-binding protein [Syntrophales bacterium]|nr:ATP-binding protein [Syntrophales bacterium]HON22909.1 ATP-binding protein [Syntrophales bacterium]HPC31516.1 ATP-binding protein [Syntrophales bacterium]HQG34733.1 ATP-binding protein [Syntrophales bacterium]HQI34819.1 ATP-binding protein [Syntrophales bacterium]
MTPSEKIVWQDRTAKESRPFLQPIAVAIVCVVFLLLILIMGIMDMRRLDNTLVGILENRAQGIVEVVQRLAQENLNNLVQASQRDEKRSFVPVEQEAFSPQKLLINALVQLGQEVDVHWKKERLSGSYLRKYAEEKGIWMIAVLNRQGKPIFQSRPLPAGLVEDNPAPKLSLDLLNRLGQEKKVGFIALRRKDGSGTVIIALDPDGLRFWGTKVSVEKALQELGGGRSQGLTYFMITDTRDKVLASAGDLPEKWQAGEMPVSELLAGSRALASRKVVYRDRPLLDVAVPVYLNKQTAGIARMGLEREGMERILAENRKNIAVFMGLTMVIAFLSMWVLYMNQNRHLEGIVAMERRLEKAERLSALGQLAAGVAHEIRNPLNAISMASQRLKRDFVPADAGKAREFQTITGVIRDEIRRLNGIIEEFLTFSRSRRLDLREYPVTEVLQKIVNLLREETAEKGIVIETRWSEPSPVIPMDVDKLQQALLNFIKNAVESIAGEGRVTLSVGPEKKGWIRIAIVDTGCGMTAEEIERIFSPEYTTKEKGLGLGLPLSHEIIRGHGGEIRVTSRKDMGTTFEIILPVERPGTRTS